MVIQLSPLSGEMGTVAGAFDGEWRVQLSAEMNKMSNTSVNLLPLPAPLNVTCP